jgi:hypothetical protein
VSGRGGSCAILGPQNDLRFIFQNLPGLIDCRLTNQPNRVVFTRQKRGATDGDKFSEGVTMDKRTKSTMIGWTKTGRGEYVHAVGHRVKKTAQGWAVSGPNRNDGHVYTTMHVAMYAAAKTPEVWAN